MIRILSRLFRGPPPKTLFEHPRIGLMRFDPASSTWESTADMEVYFGGIPGSRDGPDDGACQELLGRMDSIAHYWEVCDEDLRFLLEEAKISGAPRDVMRVAAVAFGEGEWEICFETLPEHHWLYAGMQFQGEELMTNTIDL